jgi:hypothetical protein
MDGDEGSVPQAYHPAPQEVRHQLLMQEKYW